MLSSTLHTLNKTAQTTALNLKLSQCISEHDEVILIEDGVYQCLDLPCEPIAPTDINTDASQAWMLHAKTIYALKEDALARGVPLDAKGVLFVTHEEFVKLSLAHQKVISWY